MNLEQLWASLGALDGELYGRVRGLARDASTITSVRRFSALGQHGLIWLVLGAIGALLDRQRRHDWLKATKLVAGSYGLSTAIKFIVRRPRPDLPNLPQLMSTPTQLSFPSSHAVTSFAGARAFAGLVPPAPLYATATAMAASRVYLGLHFPSDVLFGAGLGDLIGRLRK